MVMALLSCPLAVGGVRCQGQKVRQSWRRTSSSRGALGSGQGCDLAQTRGGDNAALKMQKGSDPAMTSGDEVAGTEKGKGSDPALTGGNEAAT